MALQEGSAFIRDVIANLEASKQRDTEQPILYLRMQLAQYALVQVGRLVAEGCAGLVDGGDANSLRAGCCTRGCMCGSAA